MDARFIVIQELLEALEQVKGRAAVGLHCLHWMPSSGTSGHVISARGFTYAGDQQYRRDPPPRKGPHTDNSRKPSGQRDGALREGEHGAFEVCSPVDGSLFLFSLGCGGTCSRIVPSKAYPDNRVCRGEPRWFPARELLEEDALAEGDWLVRGPATAVTGHLEYLLAIVTREPVRLRLCDLHDGLVEDPEAAQEGARSVDGELACELLTPALFSLPAHSWEYGLLAMEVLGHAGRES